MFADFSQNNLYEFSIRIYYSFIIDNGTYTRKLNPIAIRKIQ